MKRFLVLPLVAVLSSCAVFKPSERADLNEDLPAKFSLFSEEAPATNGNWWASFESAELNGFVAEALTNSPSLQQAWARLAQADAVAKKAGAARLPSLGYAGSGSGNRSSKTDGTAENYSAGLAASYELDLWGRVKSLSAAAALDRDASRADLDTAAITLASRVTSSWAGILSSQLQTEVLLRQLESNKTSLELIELRFRKSFASALDVYQQRQAVAGTESRIPLSELREQLLLHELAVLLGRADFDALTLSDTALPEIATALPSIGIPADVLANRPDVRKAGLRLQSADWSVSAARADRLPTIRLTAAGSYGGNNISSSDIFDDWAANLAASITGPIFEGGRRKAEVKRARAVADERLAAYRETVLNAVREVEDALVSEQKQREYLVALDRSLELSRQSYKEAVNRYRNGLIEYLPVLVELVGLQNRERDRVEAQFNLLQYRINLHRALGGTIEMEKDDA